MNAQDGNHACVPVAFLTAILDLTVGFNAISTRPAGGLMWITLSSMLMCGTKSFTKGNSIVLRLDLLCNILSESMMFRKSCAPGPAAMTIRTLAALSHY